MIVFNKQVAETFSEIADLLEIKGASVFRVRAYRRAANSLRTMEEDISNFSKDELKEIPGIGDDLAEKILEIQKTGRLKYLEEKRKEVPKGLLKIMQVPGIGPKMAELFYEELKVQNVNELQKAAKNGDLIKLPGIKEKTVENILNGIRILKENHTERLPYSLAKKIADEIIKEIKKEKVVDKIEIAGSLRRKEKTIGDIDLLATSKNPEKAMDAFVNLNKTIAVLGKGKTKASIRTENDLQVDLRIVPKESYGAALLYFTGNKSHNIRLRKIAIQKGLKLSEYGLFERETNKNIASKTEKEIYEKLELEWIPPEKRTK